MIVEDFLWEKASVDVICRVLFGRHATPLCSGKYRDNSVHFDTEILFPTGIELVLPTQNDQAVRPAIQMLLGC